MAESDHLDALAPGYRMHWYTVERVLGQGGFGITYLARDNNLDQRVAIKEYLPVDVAARRADATVRSRGEGAGERFRWGLDRFIQEARTLARFDHANIVRVHSVFEFNGTAYMVMRFEEGENLAALIERRGNLAEKEVLRVLLPILDGLELVHNAGFIHRDIKPDNIHIRTDGTPVLLDFGSARHALGRARTLTILVAPGYAPFEQYYSNSENQGPWTDIYSLGATCYRAISGVPPLDAITRSKGILGSTREVLVPARNIGAGRYSGQFLAAIDHALAFAEKDRPQSIAAWRTELTGPAPHASEAPLTSVLQTAQIPPAPPAPLPLSAPAPEPTTGSLKAPFAGAAVGAILAAAAVMVWMQPRDDPRITEIERRLEAQRQKDEQAKKDEQLRMDAERRRVADEEERSRLRLAEAKKTEAASTPTLPPRKAEVAVAAPLRKELPVAKPLPPVIRAPEPVLAPSVEVTAAPKPPDSVTATETVATIAPSAPPPAAGKPSEPAAALPKDDAGLLAHYRKLALQGDSEAALRVGEMYEAGRGVTQSNNWAYSWYAVAERRGIGAAKPRKDAIGARLQPREREQGDRFADRQAGPAK